VIDAEGLAGHHYIPQSLWKKEPLQSDTRRVFDRATTGPIPGGHNYGGGHSQYNSAVRDLYDDWKNKNGIQCEKMTPQQANDFVNKIKQSSNPAIRNFNNKILMKIIMGVMRRIPVRGNE